ncbi:DUF4399 domain-containing protein [Methylobacterium longum]|uniref:DUF4399 domain-containing protein n=2 Tax=Methylobacterium longum TaxID=767694 RepID=A0ABT8AV74_9HYPH|nr:DUF4399 domain-containing protein [Methylobacterium longum]MDN3573320.1 DUF4399 domain-containing protein [Methylobacterium longum]
MCFAGIMLLGSPSYAQTPAPADAELYLISPRDGAKLRSPITVRFGLKNMGVTHAGDTAPNMGHHHLLVDATDPINPSEPLPSNKKYLHFGAGQTETKLELPPGNHTLQLVLGDANHKPFKPVVSSKIIHIRVLRSNADAAL